MEGPRTKSAIGMHVLAEQRIPFSEIAGGVQSPAWPKN